MNSGLTKSEIRKVVKRKLKKAGSVFGIRELENRKHAVSVIEHLIENSSPWDIEDFAEQRAYGLASKLFSIAMEVWPEQFGDVAKASIDFRSEDSYIDLQAEIDESRFLQALRHLRCAEQLMKLPKDFYVRRKTDRPVLNDGDQGLRLPQVPDRGSSSGYRPPDIEAQRTDSFTPAEDPADLLWVLIEAANDQDVIDMRSSHARSSGPKSVGTQAARQLLEELDTDQNFVNCKSPYHSPWAAISELLSLVGCMDMSAEQVRQACSVST